MHHYFLITLAACALSAASMPLLIRLARTLGIVDRPAHRKIHLNPTPYLGGAGILLGTLLVPLAAYFFSSHAHHDQLIRILLLLAPCAAAGLLGLVDDKFQVRARVKLLVQIAIFLVFTAFFGTFLSLVRIPGWGIEDLNDIGIPLTIAWMLGVINGVNLIDGVDGLAACVTAIIYAAIAWLAFTLRSSTGAAVPDIPALVVALAALGATLGFLFFNWKPAKIYMGDAGSLASGALIATLLISLGRPMRVSLNPAAAALPVEEPFPYQFGTITLLAAYPLMEISLTIVRRLLTGKPVGNADKGHVHHRLLRFGFSAPMICGLAALLTLLAAAVAIALSVHYHGLASGLLVAGGILFVLLMHFCGFLELLRPRFIKGNRPHFLIANYFMSMQRAKLDLAESIPEIEALAAQTCIEFDVARYALHVTRPASATPLQLDWVKPASAHAAHLLAADQNSSGIVQSFSDKVELEPGTFATWTFEPHMIEDEIDVEYRVLVNDFMRKAVARAQSFARSTLEPPGAPPKAPGISSTALRRRGASSARNPKA